MRSYSAARRDVDGVAGTVSASSPNWLTGVEGLLFREGLDGNATGVREVLGVESSLIVLDVDGVNTPALAFRCKETGVIGNGIANSFGVRLPTIIRGFVGDEERLGEGGACGSEGLGVARVLGDLGEMEARRWVRADCFGACKTSGGRSARGREGTTEDLMWSCRAKHRRVKKEKQGTYIHF